jgi:hypothetical protein
MTKLIIAALGITAVAVAIAIAPDVRRYLRIRAM